MAKLRLLFKKYGPSSYISNLDLLRTFQRVFPRTGLEIKHTQGFHPHPIISFPLPLPVGQSSDCELMDFEITQNSYPTNVCDMLNSGMPEGIVVLDCYEPVRPSKELTFLKVQLDLEYDFGIPEGASSSIRKMFSQDTLLIDKRTKHKDLVKIDIIPLIKNISSFENENILNLEAIISAQNPGLNPIYIDHAIQQYIPKFASSYTRIHRLELLDQSFKQYR